MSTATGPSPEARLVNVGKFPRTRYQGSKRKLASSIVEHLSRLEFDTVLDGFGGTGAVAYALKCVGKSVTYNDVLSFNHQIGMAFIENDSVRLPDERIASICQKQSGVTNNGFIEQTFDDIYFTPEENHWLDIATANIRQIICPYQRAIAWFALFQSAMAKRPYNLFHRKNLYMRKANVERSFGNKTSWDRPFDHHFQAFAREANEAIYNAQGRCRALCKDVLTIEPEFDLVYIDTPYINRSGVGVDYRDFYHFLEGMMNPEHWPAMIDIKSKHRRLSRHPNPWCDPNLCHDQFRRLFEHFSTSTLVVSYRSDGIPTVEELVASLKRVKQLVQVIDGSAYQYALSTNRKNREILIIAADQSQN